MEINIRDDTKIVEIWLTNEEKHDEALMESLKLIYALCKEKGYKAAVFKSGNGNLFDSALGLLLYNRIRLAEEE